MEHLKTGTVEIRQHVETTPMVSKDVAPGTIFVSRDQANHKSQTITTYTIVGHKRTFTFIGDEYVRAYATSTYVASSMDTILEDTEKISYLRSKAQKTLGSLIQEIEEGIFDD